MTDITPKHQATRRRPAALRRYPYLTETGRFSTYPPFDLLNPYLLLVIAVNFFCIFLQSYTGDMDYWRDWAEHLATKGYAGFPGNYPPLYLHWLYLSGKLMSLLGHSIEINNLFKFLVLLPVVFSHVVLARIVFSILMHRAVTGWPLHAVMLLTALNPALLMNGPVWGQVDIIPTTFVVCALYLMLLNRYLWLMLPLFTLAVLTKFQMICFAPVFAIVFFRNAKNTLVGCGLSGIAAGLVVLPPAISSNLGAILYQAYIETLGTYPYATYNAANIWMLLTGNTWPDSTVLFGIDKGGIAAQLFTVKRLGILLFAAACLSVFMYGLRQQFRSASVEYSRDEAGRHVFYAMFCATAFFVLLPGMHERYLVPAVIISLLYAAVEPRKMAYTIILTLTAFLNIAMIHGINGSQVWPAVSMIAVAAMACLLIDLTAGSEHLEAARRRFKALIGKRHVPAVTFATATLTVLLILHNSHSLHRSTLDANQKLLTDLPIQHVEQEYGTLKLNRNINNNILSLNGTKYAHGLGTHADSSISYDLPDGVESIRFTVGIDDQVKAGEAVFSVLGDGKRLWRSKRIHGNMQQTEHAEVQLTGIDRLTLKVDAGETNAYDHANWINPVITFKDERYIAEVTHAETSPDERKTKLR